MWDNSGRFDEWRDLAFLCQISSPSSGVISVAALSMRNLKPWKKWKLLLKISSLWNSKTIVSQGFTCLRRTANHIYIYTQFVRHLTYRRVSVRTGSLDKHVNVYGGGRTWNRNPVFRYLPACGEQRVDILDRDHKSNRNSRKSKLFIIYFIHSKSIKIQPQ